MSCIQDLILPGILTTGVTTCYSLETLLGKRRHSAESLTDPDSHTFPVPLHRSHRPLPRGLQWMHSEETKVPTFPLPSHGWHLPVPPQRPQVATNHTALISTDSWHLKVTVCTRQVKPLPGSARSSIEKRKPGAKELTSVLRRPELASSQRAHPVRSPMCRVHARCGLTNPSW